MDHQFTDEPDSCEEHQIITESERNEWASYLKHGGFVPPDDDEGRTYDDEFVAVWRALEERGACDAIGGCAFHRIYFDYLQRSEKPSDLEGWIERESNLGPYAIEDDEPLAHSFIERGRRPAYDEFANSLRAVQVAKDDTEALCNELEKILAKLQGTDAEIGRTALRYLRRRQHSLSELDEF